MLLGVTVHWAEVYLRIWEEHFPQWRGDTQAPSNRKSRIPTAVIGGCSWCVLLSQQVDKGVVNFERLAKASRTGFWRTGQTGRANRRSLGFPVGASVPRTDQNVQDNQGPGCHKPLSIAMGEWHSGPTATSERVLRWVNRSALIARHVGTTVKG